VQVNYSLLGEPLPGKQLQYRERAVACSVGACKLAGPVTKGVKLGATRQQEGEAWRQILGFLDPTGISDFTSISAQNHTPAALSCQVHQIDIAALGSHGGSFGSFADLFGLFLASNLPDR
jgi:hypothetical protein